MTLSLSHCDKYDAPGEFRSDGRRCGLVPSRGRHSSHQKVAVDPLWTCVARLFGWRNDQASFRKRYISPAQGGSSQNSHSAFAAGDT